MGGPTSASTSLARQLGVSFGPALATTIWALSAHSPRGIQIVLAASAALGAAALISLALQAQAPADITTRRAAYQGEPHD